MKPLSNPYLAALLLIATAETAMADRLVDPTRPAHAKEIARDAHQPLRLEAILRAEGRALAIVNGKVVRVGDHVGEVRIEEIGSDSIRYTRAGRTKTARLPSERIAVRSNVTANGEPK